MSEAPEIAAPPLPNDSARAAFTVEEFITRVVPMSRGTFYSEVKAGKIRVVKRGWRTLIPASEGHRYIASLPEKSAPEPRAA